MDVADFDYELPPGQIAQQPLSDRDASRLLVLDRRRPRVRHARFADLPDLLAADDLLVLNDTRVLPARLSARKPSGGRVELLLLEPAGEPRLWHCLLRASRKPAPGTRLSIAAGVAVEVVGRDADRWTVRFDGDPVALLERFGSMPLPPYIRREGAGDPRDAEDRERYQTVYGRVPGAVAAPTAGLHFTERTLERLAAVGVRRTALTLHVGPGTFQPVRVERLEDHVMHRERFELPASAAEAVGETRRRGGRVVAVGTTVVRTLEERATDERTVRAGAGDSGLFIYPGFRFRVVDALLTNFHLPRSTLLMLVAALAGRERVLAAYREAVREGYRFYSYGDGMLIL